MNQSDSFIIVFGPNILDSLLDGFFGKHRAVQLNGRQFEVTGNIGVLDLQGLLDLHTFDELGCV